MEYIGAAYSNAHIIQVPSPSTNGQRTGDPEGGDQLPTTPLGTTSNIGQFIAHGVRQKPEVKGTAPGKFNFLEVNEEDRLWVQLMLKATHQCGYDAERISDYVRAVVEEAMALSLKMIADPRYNKLEEDSQDPNIGRDKAWAKAKSSFIDGLYEKWGSKLPRRANMCPLNNADITKTDSRLL